MLRAERSTLSTQLTSNANYAFLFTFAIDLGRRPRAQSSLHSNLPTGFSSGAQQSRLEGDEVERVMVTRDVQRSDWRRKEKQRRKKEEEEEEMSERDAHKLSPTSVIFIYLFIYCSSIVC